MTSMKEVLEGFINKGINDIIKLPTVDKVFDSHEAEAKNKLNSLLETNLKLITSMAEYSTQATLLTKADEIVEKSYLDRLTFLQLELTRIATPLKKITVPREEPGLFWSSTVWKSESSPLAERIQRLADGIPEEIRLIESKRAVEKALANKNPEPEVNQETLSKLDKLVDKVEKLSKDLQSNQSYNHAVGSMYQQYRYLSVKFYETLNLKTIEDQQARLNQLAITYNDGKFNTPLLENTPAVFPLNATYKHLSNITPSVERTEYSPLEGAMSLFSFAMSPLRAACATLLYRYFLKLQGEYVPNSTGNSYKLYEEERSKANIDEIKKIISLCILYLFMEYDKALDYVLRDKENPLLKLATLAKDLELSKLTKTMDKIKALPDKIQLPKEAKPTDLDKLEVEVRSVNSDGSTKPVHNFASKHALTFFQHNSHFKNKDLASACGRIYQLKTKYPPERLTKMGKTEDQVLNELRTQMRALYTK